MSNTTYINPEATTEYIDVIRDILSHAITGEVVGMTHFAMMAGLTDEVEERMEFVEHADSERRHAVMLQKIADEIGVEVLVKPDSPYWKRITDHFRTYVAEGNLTACILVQEIILESMAVGMYREVGKGLDGTKLGWTFSRLGEEEGEHRGHSVEELKEHYQSDPEAFVALLKRVHYDVVTVLAEMMAREDGAGHCQVCWGSCIKESMSIANLKISDLRGHTLRLYAEALDAIGVEGELTLELITNLPN